MDSQVTELISNFESPNEFSATGLKYTTLYGEKHKFNILPERLGAFFESLCDIVDEDIQAESANKVDDYRSFGIPIAEIILKPIIPVSFHLKISFDVPEEERKKIVLCPDEFIIELIYNIQSSLSERLVIGPNLSELLATVEMSDSWITTSGKEAISLRIMFPYCHVDVNYQRNNLRRHVLDKIYKAKVTDLLPYRPNETIDQIFQPIREYFLMYRSKENEIEAPMLISHIYKCISEDDMVEDNVNNLVDDDLSLLFNPSHYQYIYTRIISGDFLNTNRDTGHWLPLILSLHFWNGEVPIKRSIDMSPNISYSPNSDSAIPEGVISYNEGLVTSKEPKIMASYLLKMLSIDRYNVEPFWRDIGQILFNIYKGSQEGLNLFIIHSTRATVPGRGKDDCYNAYKLLRYNQLTVATLAWYAKKDSPRAYEEWHQKWAIPSLYGAFSTDHDDVAELVYRVYWLDYICTNYEKDIWYAFDEHRLRRQDGCVDIQRAISNHLIPFILSMKDSFGIQYSQKNEDKKQGEVYSTQAIKLCKLLKSSGYISSCIRMAKQKFYVKDFDKYKDADPCKTGWANCVVVCLGERAYTMDGKPEDYITKSTYTQIRTDLSWEHPLVIKFNTWMGQIFPDNDLLRYVLKDFASFLYGKNAEKLLRAWSGDGDNSKTMLAKLIQLVLGAYCIDFPPSMLTGKTVGTSGPTPELAQAAGAHVGFVPETEHDEKIREGTVKRYTGGDRFFARMCRDDGGSLEAFFKLIIMCNSIPEFTAISKALRNRFLYIPFLSRWVDDPPEDLAEQYKQRRFKKDPYFENKIPEMALAAAWVMIQYYPIYKREGLKPPPIVMEYTERHWSENDPILGFITECINQTYTIDPNNNERTVDNSKSFTASEAHLLFTKWHRRNYPNVEVPSMPTFKQDLTGRIGPQQKGKRWFGLELIRNNKSDSLSIQ